MKTAYESPELLQLRVLRLSFFQDGDVGVGVFPEREEILISGPGFDSVALQSVGTGETEMCQCANGVIHDDAAMAEDFLEIGGAFVALTRYQMGFSSHKNAVETRPTVIAGRRLS